LFRSRQVNQRDEFGICPRSMYGLGTTGWRETVTLMIAWRSWTGLYPLSGFFTGRSGVFQGD
jgi:hypothetical protein